MNKSLILNINKLLAIFILLVTKMRTKIHAFYMLVILFYNVFIVAIMSAVGQNIECKKWYDESELAVKSAKPTFKFVWNMPTFMCQKHGINFTAACHSWGITHNSDGLFRGDEISLLYDPGNFPALLEATEMTESEPRNGGVPQEGNITLHIDLFRKTLSKLIPNPQFNGIGVIDFEHWRPVWRENWGSLNKYRDFSISIENHRHPRMKKEDKKELATKRYEAAAKRFMMLTLLAAKKLYPNALWGYYGYPFCFNYKAKSNKFPCTKEVLEDNDRIKWLFKESTVLFPSMYLRSKDMTAESNMQYIKGRMEEARRLAKVGDSRVPIYAYIWPKYSDANRFLSNEDILNSLRVPKKEGANGVVIWGASKDVNTKEKCLSVEDYLNRILGPIIKHLIDNKEKVNSSFLNVFNT